MEAVLKQAMIDRRTAKSAFTRAGKAVVHDAKRNRPAVEVREAIDKLKGVYEIFIEKPQAAQTHVTREECDVIYIP